MFRWRRDAKGNVYISVYGVVYWYASCARADVEHEAAYLGTIRGWAYCLSCGIVLLLEREKR
jgi:hypothetical protein